MADDDQDLAVFRWPAPGINILDGDNDEKYLALLEWQNSPDMRAYGYISGFRMAAQLMFDHVKETGMGQDSLVFPFGLCWRHHMELQLKNLLITLQRYHREPRKAPSTHDLEKLWKAVHPRLEKARPEDDPADLDSVEAMLMQLHAADGSAQEFRYATKNDKTPSLGGVPSIDLAAFHDAMIRLSNFFDGADTAVDEDRHQRNEYEDWLRSEAEGWGDG